MPQKPRPLTAAYVTVAWETDCMVKEVAFPDGNAALILDYPLRLRFRDGQDAEDVRLAQPGRMEQLAINM